MIFDSPEANQRLSDTAAEAPPATFMERFQAADKQAQASGLITSRLLTMSEDYDRRIKAIKDAGLGDLSDINPMTSNRRPQVYSEGHSIYDMEPLDFSNEPHKVFQKRLEELAQKYPEQAHIIGADKPVTGSQAYQAAKKEAEATSSSYGGAPLTGPIADFAGGMYAMRKDPANIVALGIGPTSHVGKGAKAVLMMGAKQAAANMAVETAMQPFIQSWRKSMNDTYGFWQSAEEIAMAGAFGFGADVGIRSLYRGVQSSLGRKAILDTEGKVTGYESGADAAARAAAAAEHQRRIQIQQNLEALPKDTFDKIAQGDDEALTAFAKAVKADEDPSVAGAINALRNTDRVTLDGIDDGWRERSLLQQLRSLEDPSEPAPVHFDSAAKAERPRLADDAELPRGTEGNQHYRMLELDNKPVRFEAVDANRITTEPETFQFKGGRDATGASNALRAVDFDGTVKGKVIVYEREDGSLVVADGHDRVSLANRAPEPQKLDALVFREKDGWTAEQVRAEAARKNIQEGTGSLMDVAGAIRRHPEIVDDSMAVSTDFMADARSIARLSDEAFDAVAGGQFNPKHGVMVSDLVPDQARHMEVLRELDRRNPPTEAAARREIGNMLREPANIETLTRVMDIPLAEPHVIEARNDVLAGVLTAMRSDVETQAASAVIRRLAEKPGLVSDTLAQAGRAVAEGQPIERAIDATLRRFEEVIGKAGVKGLADQPVRLSPSNEPPRFLAALAGSDAAVGRSMRADLDKLGYYSKALEAAKSLKQAKGTPEQMLSQLKSAGVKDAEIEATGLSTILGQGASWAVDPSATPAGKEVSSKTWWHQSKSPTRPGKFDLSLATTANGDNALGRGVYFSHEKDRAAGGGGDLSEYRVRAVNPFEFTPANVKDVFPQVKQTGIFVTVGKDYAKFADILLSKGYDSVVSRRPDGSIKELAVLKPENIAWAGPQLITRDEIVKHLTENRVGVNEVEYGGNETARLRDRIAQERFGKNYDQLGEGYRAGVDAKVRAETNRGAANGPKWQSYSLDPSNPTYRETVLHLPMARAEFVPHPTEQGKFAIKRPDGSLEAYPDGKPRAFYSDNPEIIDNIEKGNGGRSQFQSGHFSEPNIIGHMMTSMNRHEGKPVFTLDQIQSDWGQKLRDGGVRDEAKIAELKVKLKEVVAKHNPALDAWKDFAMNLREGRDPVDWLPTMSDGDLSGGMRKAENWFASNRNTLSPEQRADFQRLFMGLEYGRRDVSLISAELHTAERSAPGHPLVNTTDQWTNTTIRRALRQAVEADAEYIAIPHGDTVLSYNPGDEGGMRGFYGSRFMEGIVPKNLRKLLEKIDKDSAKPLKVETLDTPSGQRGWKQGGQSRFDKSQTGFTLFPLTDKVKKSILEEGQPLFAKPAENITPTKLNELAENLRQALDEATTPPPGRLDDPIKDAPKQVERLREDLAEDIAAVMPPKLAAAEMPKAKPENGIPSLVDLYQRYSTQGREALDAVMPGTGRMIDEFVQANPEVVARIAEALGAPTGRPQAAQMLEQAMPQFMSPRIIDMSKPVLLTPEANARMREIRTAIDETVKMLPPEYRIRVEDSLVFNFGDGDKRLDGLHDGYEKLIYVSMAAGDPVRTSRHEVIHALRQSGLMKDEEFAALYKFADRLGLRKAYEIDAQYKEPYTQAYGNRGADFVEQLLREETVANMFSDYSLNGRRFGDVAGGGMVDRLIDMIVTFMKQVRDIMGGYGFRNVYDVFESIESGAMARRGMGDAQEASRLAMFAGENAKTADLDALAKAKQMDAEGKPREAIWKDTGWFKGVDGKWRFEISDDKANLDLKEAISDGWEPNQRWPADHLFNHRELFSAYPAMRETGIQYRPFPANLNDAAAAFGQRSNLVSLNSGYRNFANERTMQSFGLHELQHVVQSLEEMARGGNSSKFTKEMLEAERARIAAEQAARPKLDDWTAVDNSIAPADMTDVDLGRSLYRRLAGEAEARLVQKRQKMTPEERRSRPPWLDYDVPEADQIVRMANEAIQMSIEDKPLARDLADVQRDREGHDVLGACRA